MLVTRGLGRPAAGSLVAFGYGRAGTAGPSFLNMAALMSGLGLAVVDLSGVARAGMGVNGSSAAAAGLLGTARLVGTVTGSGALQGVMRGRVRMAADMDGLGGVYARLRPYADRDVYTTGTGSMTGSIRGSGFMEFWLRTEPTVEGSMLGRVRMAATGQGTGSTEPTLRLLLSTAASASGAGSMTSDLIALLPMAMNTDGTATVLAGPMLRLVGGELTATGQTVMVADGEVIDLRAWLTVPTVDQTYTMTVPVNRYPIGTGQTVILKDGVVTVTEYPGTHELDTADAYYLGGRDPLIRRAEAEAIADAGRPDLVEFP